MSKIPATYELITQVWEMDCSRCANVGVSYEPLALEAALDLAERGWTDMCPACNGAIA